MYREGWYHDGFKERKYIMSTSSKSPVDVNLYPYVDSLDRIISAEFFLIDCKYKVDIDAEKKDEVVLAIGANNQRRKERMVSPSLPRLNNSPPPAKKRTKDQRLLEEWEFKKEEAKVKIKKCFKDAEQILEEMYKEQDIAIRETLTNISVEKKAKFDMHWSKVEQTIRAFRETME